MRAPPNRRPRARRPPIGGGTRVYAILGDPIAHSLSPAMQNAAFAASGLDAVYVPLHVGADGLAAAVAGLRACAVAGWNVTVPHKEAMATLVDELRPRARGCGAVNTVLHTARGLVGDNTDGAGFVAALRGTGRSPRGMEILLVGAGGSARGVAAALLAAGGRRLVIANRTRARADGLAAALGSKRAVAAGLEVLADRAELARFALVVNCTSATLGTAALPRIPFAATRVDALCCDLMYGEPSPFLRHAARAHRATMDGLGMLLHQGALAFTLWTHRQAPLEVMRRALAAVLRDLDT
ncbi:MAG: shikimate dehydrogenase [Deltaproteobacteria bacterium]|nr:shikimate dehydrogenase [Deltaproteobacteria bacterium]